MELTLSNIVCAVTFMLSYLHQPYHIVTFDLLDFINGHYASTKFTLARGTELDLMLVHVFRITSGYSSLCCSPAAHARSLTRLGASEPSFFILSVITSHHHIPLCCIIIVYHYLVRSSCTIIMYNNRV